ncbi:hypothetical protein QE368_000675 [Asaia bogorensis NBRC 16594]|nr:hypothetical protein [Asaia bogorensis NBRC 16594]
MNYLNADGLRLLTTKRGTPPPEGDTFNFIHCGERLGWRFVITERSLVERKTTTI